MDSELPFQHRDQVEAFQRKHQIGLVTLLFTDTAGSTKLKQVLGDCDAVALIHHHHAGVREILSQSPGRRLTSSASAREAIKHWDVGTRPKLLTLGGAGSTLGAARWSADGDVILVGAPWQAWRAPSWEEIAAAEAKDPPAPGYGGQGKAAIKQP